MEDLISLIKKIKMCSDHKLPHLTQPLELMISADEILVKEVAVLSMIRVVEILCDFAKEIP